MLQAKPAALYVAFTTLWCASVVQMNAVVAKTEETAIPVSDVVRVVVEAATTEQPQV